MLEIVKSNSKTSNNSASLVIVTLAINIIRLAIATLAILVIATPLKLTTLTIPVIAAPLKHNTRKAARGCVASNTS